MADLDKVIKGLRCIAGDVVWCAQCQYSDVNGSGRGDRCKSECAKDTLALLKAQDPVKPEEQHPEMYGIFGYPRRFICGNCRNNIWRKNNYCPNCGRKVGWDG